MASNSHEMFVTPEDYVDWDKYVEQCDRIELRDRDRQRCKDSIRYLRTVLGEGYLRRAQAQRNPTILRLLLNSAPAARLTLIRFAEALTALEDAPNFKAVLRRIKRRVSRPEHLDEAAEGMSVVGVAHNFSRAGFAIEFEPDVSVPNRFGVHGPKKPDMKITNPVTGEEIIVEVSRMRASDHQNRAERTFEVIWGVLVGEGMHSDPEALKDVLRPRHILPYALIHRGMEVDELKSVVGDIRRLVSRVRAGGAFGEMIIPGVIEVGIASYDDHERALEWAAARGIKRTTFVEGPGILADEIARAKVKLSTKVKQLPEDRPGIVVMPAGENLILFAFDAKGIAEALAEEVGKYPKLLRAILFHTFDDGRDDSASVSIGPHTLARRIRSDGAVEQSLIVRNARCAHAVGVETLEMMDQAFAAG
jgi:hypothetical protein